VRYFDKITPFNKLIRFIGETKMRKTLASLFIILGFNGISLAEAAVDPSKYLEDIAKKMIIAVEQNKEALKTDDSLAEKLVKEYLLPVIDTQAFSSKTLGSKTWETMTAEQQKTFESGYINQVINKYAKGLSFYDGQNFIFQDSEFSKKSGNARVKSSMQQSGSEAFRVDYILSKTSDKWLITNIYVEGTNMRKSYKNQFTPRIKEIGIEKFLEELTTPKMAE
jgi:phospholipid transport system substrate-binding protein